MTDTDLIKIMLVENSREIMDVTNIFRITVHNHLMILYQSMWSLDFTAINGDQPYKSRLYVWFTSSVIWKRSFLEETGYEIWILYQNVHRKRILSKDNRPLTVAKPGFHPKKVLLSIWWNWKCLLSFFHKMKPLILLNIIINLINWKPL